MIRSNKIHFIKEIIITTLSAYFSTLPYVMYTFGTVSIYALVANILVVPFVPVAMLVSFLLIISSHISHTVSLVIGFLDTVIVSYIIFVARLFERFPFSKVEITISFSVMVAVYSLLFFISNYYLVKHDNETVKTKEGEYLTDIIKY